TSLQYLLAPRRQHRAAILRQRLQATFGWLDQTSKFSLVHSITVQARPKTRVQLSIGITNILACFTTQQVFHAQLLLVTMRALYSRFARAGLACLVYTF